MGAGIRVALHLALSLGAVHGFAKRVRVPAMSKSNLPSKVCVVCNRPFTWRKKWERCWDEVTTCSKRCNTERRKLKHQNKEGSGSPTELSDDDSVTGCQGASPGKGREESAPASTDATGSPDAPSADQGSRKARRDAKKAAKAERRAAREGTADPAKGQKQCDMCGAGVDLLIRCQVDKSGMWKMACGKCWKLPTVAGGVVDGDGTNPHYRYGGLWKNRNVKQTE